MVHFLYPQFRGNPANREHRLIFEEAGADKPPVEPTPVEAQGEAAPVSAESAEPAAVIEKKDAAVDATQKEADATPAPDTTSPEPIIVEGTGGKKLGVLVASRLPGNEGKTEKDFDNAQPKKGEEKDILTGQPPTKAPDTAKEAAEPVVAEVTNEQMESVAYQDMGLDGIPKKDVAITLSPDRRSGEMFHRDGTSLGTVEFGVDGEVSGTTPNVEAIATLKQKTEAKDKAADAAKEKGEKASDDPEMDKLGKEVDQGVKDLEAAKTPAQALAALGKILSAIIEMVKRTLGMDTDAEKREDRADDSGRRESDVDTSTERGLRTELKERGATSIEDQREELADMREKAEGVLEQANEGIEDVDAEVDELQTEKDTVDDQIQSVKKQLIDIEQGQDDGDAGALRKQLQRLERKSERIQQKIDDAMESRREWVQLKERAERTIALIDKLESRLDTLESTFDKIEQALQKKFDVTVKIERDDGKTVFNITTLGEGTPVWFKEFVEEHDEDGNVNNGYQIDVSKAEQLSQMPESKQTEQPAEDATETPTEDAGEEKEDTPASQESAEQERTPENITADIASQKEAIQRTLDSSGAKGGNAEIDASLAKIGELIQELSATDDVLVGPALEDITGESFMSESDGNTYRIALEGGTFVLQAEATGEAPADTQESQPETETPTPAPAEVADTAEPSNTETFDEVSPEDAQAIDAAVNRLDAIKGMIDMGDITNIEQDFASINSELADISADKPYTSSYMESAVASKISALDLGGTVSYENGTLSFSPQTEQAPTEDPAQSEASQDVADTSAEAAPTLSEAELTQRREWANTINDRAHKMGYPVDISFINDPSSPNHGKMEVKLNTSIEGAEPQRYALLLDQASERGMRVETPDQGTAIIDVTQRVDEQGKGFFGPDMTPDKIKTFVAAKTDSLSGETA